jgi:hypothetical protein
MQALLNALGTTEYNGQKPSPEMVQQMAEKLNALLGDDGGGKDASVNQRGEVLNVFHICDVCLLRVLEGVERGWGTCCRDH